MHIIVIWDHNGFSLISKPHPLHPSIFNTAFAMPVKSATEMSIAEFFTQTTDYVNLHANSMDPDHNFKKTAALYMSYATCRRLF